MQHRSAHPYQSRPASAYWKTAVAERPGEGFGHLWKPRHALSHDTRFVTAGSCFAQRISQWMSRSGYRWLDSEPAPAGLDPQAVADNGYGVFSFRTGNIYSPALLHQWVRWAVQGEQGPAEAWWGDGRCFDPFRPSIPASGFASADEMLDARRASLAAMRETLSATDVFIFTLGLTEAWMHADGHVYPLCPGTLRGQFDPQQHRFVNLRVDEVVAHLEATLALLRELRPGIRMLLTVSPVPLTATARDEHVMVATHESKAVLRAAAAELVRRHDDIDYFPSYELIAGFQARGAWFESNLRSVTREGVDFVMAHFERGIEGRWSEPWPPRDVAQAPIVRPAAATSPDDPELVCEEERLNGVVAAQDDPRQATWCLMGDSHMQFLSRAMARAGVAHSGGMVMIGSEWCKDLFHACPQEFIVPLAQADARRRWQKMQAFFSEGDKLRPGQGRRVVTNLGVQSHIVAQQFHAWATAASRTADITPEQAVDFYRRTHARRLALIEKLLALGYRVQVVTDPATQGKIAANRPLLPTYAAYDELVAHVLGGMGCEVLIARQLLTPQGTPEHYFKRTPTAQGGNDWIHGSDAYYDDLVPWVLEDAPAVTG